MKANPLACAFLLLAAAAQSPAQNTNATRPQAIATNASEWVPVEAKTDEPNGALAQFQLGLRYINGDGVEKDELAAVKWWRKAAEQNYAPAQYNLGVCYNNGSGVKTDTAEAVKWYRKAAEQGLDEAQNQLGWMYLNGDGVNKNQAEAIKWLTKAAENGNLKAAGQLATHFIFLSGKNENIKEGMRWYRFSAERGDVTCQTTLAWFLRTGKIFFKNGGEKIPTEAAKWYLRAAHQGDSGAQIAIGEMYAQGEGVMQDFSEAYKWFNIASTSTARSIADRIREDAPTEQRKKLETLEASSDSQTPEQKYALARINETEAEEARRKRDEVAAKMTSVQIAEAQRLSRLFKPRKESESLRKEDSASVNEPTSSGTGFFISENGYLISNNHVVEGSTQIRLVTSAGLISAKVVKVDAANDLALLKAEGIFSPLPVAASRGVKLGGTVATVGFPNIGLQGFAPKLAKGEIASLSGAGDDARYFQISVPVQPGNSGGALVDERGNVVGVVSAKLSARVALAARGSLPENVNYAVKSSYLLSFLESVPEVSAKLKEPETKERKFEDVVKSAEQAAVLVLVY